MVRKNDPAFCHTFKHTGIEQYAHVFMHALHKRGVNHQNESHPIHKINFINTPRQR